MSRMLESETVDGTNPANSPVEGQVVYPVIYKVLAPSKRWLGMGFLNHQQYRIRF